MNNSKQANPNCQVSRLMLILFIIHGGYKRILLRQFSGKIQTNTIMQSSSIISPKNRQSYGPLIALRRIYQVAARHHTVTICFYAFLLTKYLLIGLLALPNLPFLPHDYQLFDCFLMGRYRFLGRTNKISGHIAVWVLAIFMTHRFVCWSSLASRFRLHALEFLLNTYEEVEQVELEGERSKQVSPMKEAASKFESKLVALLEHNNNNNGDNNQNQNQNNGDDGNSLSPEKNARKNHHQQPVRGTNLNPLFYIRNPFNLESSHQDEFYLRPNRTSNSWLKLNWLAKGLFWQNVLIFVVYLSAIYYAVGGSIFTNLGFELSAPTCVKWLRNQQARNKSAYSYIYEASEVLAYELPIEQLPPRITIEKEGLQPMTSYNLTRIAFDILENVLLTLEFLFLFTGLLTLVTLFSADILVNVDHILKEILEVVDQLERNRYLESPFEHLLLVGNHQKHQHPRQEDGLRNHSLRSIKTLEKKRASSQTYPDLAAPVNQQFRALALATQNVPNDDEQLIEKITRLQAILADHFKLIQSYNSFVSYVLILPIVYWIAYTVLMCFWMGSMNSRAIEFEFFIAEVVATMFMLTLLFSASVTRSQNRKLYPLIAKLMALDNNRSMTKLRWTIIISHYYPKPMFCFTLFSSIEISWFFCLRLISYIISVFVVLASFFYAYRT